ncbi:MAG TPA: sulfite exporter TauE/SafE family protein, partial [candidate division Zixibacteria bacterium]|nr:sulfite exporter TauE/SafE family protein [candidate division Zixibacteria bacterium]
IGAVLGLVAGMVGIGGGIFLGPVLLFLRWANIKEAAATTAAFIFLNSLSGFLAQWSRHSPDWPLLLPLAVIVLLGAQIGSFSGANLFSLRQLQKTLGALLLVASLIVGSKIL